jgi:modulator of FtsH protease HflK
MGSYHQTGGPWGGGPWGPPPRGGGSQGPRRGGSPPPDMEEMLRRTQEQLKRMVPGHFGVGRGIALAVLALFLIYLSTGFYRVQPDEQGVVMRFGRYVYTTQPGFHYHLPAPIEAVILPKVTRINRLEVGFRAEGEGSLSSARSNGSQVPEEALMLTGDENIVDINFTVFWVINDATRYLFNVRNPELTVKAAAESAMREVVGRTPIASALAEGRKQIEGDTQTLLQEILDSYGAGITVTQVQLQKVDPPAPVIDAFRDVQRARADQERKRNEAEAYSNSIVPVARGAAAGIVNEAQAYKQRVVAEAEGEAARFLSVYNAYRQAQDVTARRLYIETMQDVLKNANKVVIEKSAQASGVLPYLPLPALSRPGETSTASSSGQAPPMHAATPPPQPPQTQTWSPQVSAPPVSASSSRGAARP